MSRMETPIGSAPLQMPTRLSYEFKQKEMRLSGKHQRSATFPVAISTLPDDDVIWK